MADLHAHREHKGAALVHAAKDAMASAGEQWTAMRQSVFEELVRFDRPASAYEIADSLSRTRGKRVAPNSIYRILDIFVNTNVAMRVESANAYLANTHPGCAHDCIFLVCDSCGEATHVDHEGVSRDVRGIAAASRFATKRPIIEVRGICATCTD